jgi:hypothetical protein
MARKAGRVIRYRDDPREVHVRCALQPEDDVDILSLTEPLIDTLELMGLEAKGVAGLPEQCLRDVQPWCGFEMLEDLFELVQGGRLFRRKTVPTAQKQGCQIAVAGGPDDLERLHDGFLAARTVL